MTKTERRIARILLLPLLLTAASCAQRPGPPPVVNLESLLQEMQDREALARFPDPAYRQLQASSYNRASVARDEPGWFADSDGVSWIREEEVDGRTEYVIMEHEGPGCVTKLWTPFFYYAFDERTGPDIHIYLDGAVEPVIDANFIGLLRGEDFAPEPFAAPTARAGNLYLPIPFAESCKITLTDKAFYHLVNYRAYSPGTQVETFTLDACLTALGQLGFVGGELFDPTPLPGSYKTNLFSDLPPGDSLVLDWLGPRRAIRHLFVEVDPLEVEEDPSILRTTILRMTFDGVETVWCPLGDFFGSANALNPMSTWTRDATADGVMTCRWIMPYRESAVVAIENVGARSVDVKFGVTVDPWRWDDRSMHFHARWRPDDVLQGNEFQDWNFVDIQGKGVFVGDAWTVLNRTRGWWGEGDEKIYVDGAWDAGFPTHFGTGTEDYYGWAGGVNPTRDDVFHHPYLANVLVGTTEESNTRGFNICTRVRALDAIPFTERLVFDMEASPGTGQRNAWDLLGYSAVTFWYARPGATSNRPPQPDAARQPIMSLADLDRRSQEIRDAKVRRVPGLIEFESLTPSDMTPELRVAPQRPAEVFRPAQWSGEEHMFIVAKEPGDFVEFTLTELFSPQRLRLHVTKSFDFGIMSIEVNGATIVERLDLFHEDPIVEVLDLGVLAPLDNAFVLRFTLVGRNPRARGARTLSTLR